MDWSVYLNKRINSDLTVETDQYVLSMKPLLGSLIDDLEMFLDREGRYFGIVVHYLHDLRESLKKMEYSEDEGYGKEVMFLYRPIILRAHKKYLRRKLSRADSVICIVQCICETILRFSINDSILEIYNIFGKLYLNIKNSNKDYIYQPLVDILEECIAAGKVGLYKIDKMSIIDEERKRKIKVPLDGSGIRIDKSFNNEVSEVSWTEE